MVFKRKLFCFHFHRFRKGLFELVFFFFKDIIQFRKPYFVAMRKSTVLFSLLQVKLNFLSYSLISSFRNKAIKKDDVN